MLSQVNKEMHAALHDHPGLVKARQEYKEEKGIEALRLTKQKDNCMKALRGMYVMSDSELLHYAELLAAMIQGNRKEEDNIYALLTKNFKLKF